MAVRAAGLCAPSLSRPVRLTRDRLRS